MSIPRNTAQPIQDCPIVQWASGKTEARPLGQGRFAGYVGFHSQIGRDEALDRACEAAQIARIDIRHPRQGGPSEITPHWSLGEHLSIYPITVGPCATTIAGCLSGANAQRTAEAGIGLAWPSGERSRMALRGFLVIGDVLILAQLSVRSTMTSFLLTALLDHLRVCEGADALIDRGKHPDVVALHELRLPLCGGAEVSVGKDETSLITPLVSAHPSEISREYVASCWRTRALHEAAMEAWPGVVAWAVGYRSGEASGDADLDATVERAVPTLRGRRGRMEEAELPL